jgi:hypothetical protein
MLNVQVRFIAAAVDWKAAFCDILSSQHKQTIMHHVSQNATTNAPADRSENTL